ncbi:MAG: FkbM family methyltransferase [Bacteroidetes bacterium]|nr:FkbM family methyltransferase [Bacteroidota bacterium]
MSRFTDKVKYTLKGNYPVQIGEQTFKCDPDHLFFWRIVNKGGFEPQFFKMLDQFLSKDSVYCDIGAWIGPTAMYAARLCKKVYAFEPDDEAYRFLLKNISKNEIVNIIPYNLAIGPENGLLKMASHGGRQGDSMSSMINIAHYKNSFTAKSITWNSFINDHKPGKIDFIKMDIEGGEISVIPVLSDYLNEHKPILHLSLHPAYLPAPERVEHIRNIFDHLGFYEKVLGEKLIPVDVNHYLSGISKRPEFRSFLLLP